MDVRAEIVDGADGAGRVARGIAQDVSERKELQRALSKSGAAILSMREGVSFLDQAGRVLFTNPALDAMFGYAPGELVGRSVLELNAATDGENAAIAGAIFDAIGRDGVWDGEFENRRRDGSTFVTRARISRV